MVASVVHIAAQWCTRPPYTIVMGLQSDEDTSSYLDHVVKLHSEEDRHSSCLDVAAQLGKSVIKAAGSLPIFYVPFFVWQRNWPDIRIQQCHCLPESDTSWLVCS